MSGFEKKNKMANESNGHGHSHPVFEPALEHFTDQANRKLRNRERVR